MKISKLIVLVASITMAISGSAYADLNDGLVLHLEFEANAQDSSSYGNHGTENGVEYVDGMKGQAVSFNGQGAFIQVPDADSLDTDSVMTIATWINPIRATDPNRDSAIPVSKWYTARHDGDWFLRWAGKRNDLLTFEVANYSEYGIEDGYLPVPGGTAPKNRWQHLTAVFDNGHIKTYLNGVLVREETSIVKYTSKNEYDTDDIFFGRTWLGSYAYEGFLDDFRLYNRALSGTEVQRLYNPKCDTVIYSTDDRKLSFDTLAMELYNPITDEPAGKFALFTGGDMSLKALPGFYDFKYKGGEPVYAGQIVEASDNCYPAYSAEEETLRFPKIKVPLLGVLPDGSTVDGPAACYKAEFNHSMTQPEIFTLADANGVACE